jgi:hypothetical protein
MVVLCNLTIILLVIGPLMAISRTGVMVGVAILVVMEAEVLVGREGMMVEEVAILGMAGATDTEDVGS